LGKTEDHELLVIDNSPMSGRLRAKVEIAKSKQDAPIAGVPYPEDTLASMRGVGIHCCTGQNRGCLLFEWTKEARET
jgi:hypothetical protein